MTVHQAVEGILQQPPSRSRIGPQEVILEKHKSQAGHLVGPSASHDVVVRVRIEIRQACAATCLAFLQLQKFLDILDIVVLPSFLYLTVKLLQRRLEVGSHLDESQVVLALDILWNAGNLLISNDVKYCNNNSFSRPAPSGRLGLKNQTRYRPQLKKSSNS